MLLNVTTYMYLAKSTRFFVIGRSWLYGMVKSESRYQPTNPAPVSGQSDLFSLEPYGNLSSYVISMISPPGPWIPLNVTEKLGFCSTFMLTVEYVSVVIGRRNLTLYVLSVTLPRTWSTMAYLIVATDVPDRTPTVMSRFLASPVSSIVPAVVIHPVVLS